MTEDKKETQSSSPGNAKCFPPMRYMVASMTFLGFANIYAMRVNLSMAIAVMVANQTVIHHGTEVQVLFFENSPYQSERLLKLQVINSLF